MNEYVVSALTGIIRRDINAGLKSINKGHPIVHHMFFNLMTFAFSEVTNWPEVFLKVSDGCIW